MACQTPSLRHHHKIRTGSQQSCRHLKVSQGIRSQPTRTTPVTQSATYRHNINVHRKNRNSYTERSNSTANQYKKTSGQRNNRYTPSECVHRHHPEMLSNRNSKIIATKGPEHCALTALRHCQNKKPIAWKGLVVKTCHACQVTTPSVHKYPPIEISTPPSRNWEHLAMDLKGPLPSHAESILVIIDYKTRTTTEHIISCLEKTFAMFG